MNRSLITEFLLQKGSQFIGINQRFANNAYSVQRVLVKLKITGDNSWSYKGRRYSVMQADGNGICGEVVLDSFNKVSRDEDNILYQMYKCKYVRIFIMMIEKA